MSWFEGKKNKLLSWYNKEKTRLLLYKIIGILCIIFSIMDLLTSIAPVSIYMYLLNNPCITSLIQLFTRALAYYIADVASELNRSISFLYYIYYQTMVLALIMIFFSVLLLLKKKIGLFVCSGIIFYEFLGILSYHFHNFFDMSILSHIDFLIGYLTSLLMLCFLLNAKNRAIFNNANKKNKLKEHV